jgi:hypothetical protein
MTNCVSCQTPTQMHCCYCRNPACLACPCNCPRVVDLNRREGLTDDGKTKRIDDEAPRAALIREAARASTQVVPHFRSLGLAGACALG